MRSFYGALTILRELSPNLKPGAVPALCLKRPAGGWMFACLFRLAGARLIRAWDERDRREWETATAARPSWPRVARPEPRRKPGLSVRVARQGERHQALAAVVAAAKSTDPATKDAATRVLGEWLNTDAAPALLEIAKNDPDKKYQIRACAATSALPGSLKSPGGKIERRETKLAMFDKAMAVARRNEEKRLGVGHPDADSLGPLRSVARRRDRRRRRSGTRRPTRP